MSKKQKRRSEVRRKSSLGEDKYGKITPHLGVSPLEFIDSVINGTCDLFCDAVDTLEENFLEVFQDADPDTVKECADALLEKVVQPRLDKKMDMWELYALNNSLHVPDELPPPPTADDMLTAQMEEKDKELQQLVMELARQEYALELLKQKRKTLKAETKAIVESMDQSRDGNGVESQLNGLVADAERLSSTLSQLEAMQKGGNPASDTISPSNVETAYMQDAKALDVDGMASMRGVL